MKIARHARSCVLVWMAVCSVTVARGATADTDSVTTPLAYRDAEWYGSTFWTGPDWTRVGKDWHHPGQNTPSVRRFMAPRDGRVTITGRVFKLHLAGDGIRAGIRHNEREVWKAVIAGKDDKGVEPNLTLDVKQGEALRFVVDKLGNIGADTTGWDPAIAYADGKEFQASAAFATKKQGAGGWSYEMLGRDTSPVTGKPPVFGPEAFPEPPTAAITAAAADELLKADWLAQRGTDACADACRQELTRAERILQRMSERLDAAALGKWRTTLAQWRSRLAAPASDELYLGLRRMKRELLLADPAIDFSSILCIDNPYVHGSEAVHEIRHRNEDTATPGGRLLVLDGMRPDAPVRKLAPQGAPAAFWRPDVSYDVQRALFCMKSADEPAYHLYEVGLDGTGWRQITDGDYNDLDPICTPDGRILYTRWEYVDKEVIRVQSLWTVNPDGTGPRCYMAFQTPFPISRDLMLVSARRGKHLQTTRDAELGWFHLYLMDYDGNLELLYQGAYNILHAQPVRSSVCSAKP